MLALLFAVSLAATELESVVAVVNGVPVLASDVELAEVAGLVPALPGEDASAHHRAVATALVELELRWQDLKAAAIADRTTVDLDTVWRHATERAGGEGELHARLAAAGLPETALRDLLRRAAVVEAYVAARFAPFIRPTQGEVEAAWRLRFAPELQAAGRPVPELEEVRPQVEALLREEKLVAEVERWTEELARRAEVVRFER